MAPSRSSSASRSTLLVSVALGVALIGVAASFYATSTRNVWLADQVNSLAEVERAIATAEMAEHQLGIALLLATELDPGVTNEPSLAIDNARTTLAELNASSPESGEFDSMLNSFTDVAQALLRAIEDDDLGTAPNLAATDLTAAYEALTVDLVTARIRLVAQIDAMRSVNGIAATVSGLMVVLAVPLAMLVAYRSLASRQIRRSELETRLLEERKLSRAKDEFIANMSLDLRTPLTSISGFAQLLETDGLSDPIIAREFLGLIVNQAGELERMADDLLTTARLKAYARTLKLDSIDGAPEVDEEILRPLLLDRP